MSDWPIPLGIDVSKTTLYAALLFPHRAKPLYRSFSNDDTGFTAWQEWLVEHQALQVHACLEATSIYGHGVAVFLHQQDHQVSIVNPVRIHGYAKSQLKRTKSDRPDATLIAQFCRDLRPPAWHPSATEVQELQAYPRRLDALTQMLTQEKNRLEIVPEALKPQVEAHIAFMEEQIKAIKKQLRAHIQSHDPLKPQADLLTSIVGIRPDTAAGARLRHLGAGQAPSVQTGQCSAPKSPLLSGVGDAAAGP